MYRTFIFPLMLSQFLFEPSPYFPSATSPKLPPRGGEPVRSKLPAKSKLYVHDMFEAVLTAPSVCSALAKHIVVFCTAPPPPFLQTSSLFYQL